MAYSSTARDCRASPRQQICLATLMLTLTPYTMTNHRRDGDVWLLVHQVVVCVGVQPLTCPRTPHCMRTRITHTLTGNYRFVCVCVCLYAWDTRKRACSDARLQGLSATNGKSMTGYDSPCGHRSMQFSPESNTIRLSSDV